MNKDRNKDVSSNAKTNNSNNAADVKKSDEAMSAAEWVAKTRGQDKQRKIQTPKDVLKRMQELDEQDALSAEVDTVAANIRVIHRADHIREGTELVLTLKDTPILNEKGTDINDDGDALENVHMTADERREYLRKGAKSAYNVFDDLEGKFTGILPQYDEGNMNFKQETGFILNQEGEWGNDGSGGGPNTSTHRGGSSSSSSSSYFGASSSSSSSTAMELDGMRQKLNQTLKMYKEEDASIKEYHYAPNSSGVPEFKVQSDYMTQEEAMVKFRKPQAKTKLRRKVKPNEIVEQLAAEAELGGDHGSRAFSSKIERDAKKAMDALAQKEKAYRMAKQKAEETRAAINELATKAAQGADGAEEDEPLLRIDGEDAEGNIVFDPTEEFANHLQTAEELVATARKKAQQISDKRKEAAAAAAAQPSSASERAAGSGWHETSIEEEEARRRREEEGEDSEDEETRRQKLLEDTDVFLEPRASGSLSAALELIRQKGWITEQFSGRNNDAVVDLRYNDPAPQINLERKDETGMEMTQKEAFRRLSHKFHGKAPGKNKMEKKMRKVYEEKKIAAMSAIDTPLSSVQAFQNAQQVTKSPFVVIQGGGIDHMGLQPLQSKKERRKMDQDRPGGSESTVNKRMKV